MNNFGIQAVNKLDRYSDFTNLWSMVMNSMCNQGKRTHLRRSVSGCFSKSWRTLSLSIQGDIRQYFSGIVRVSTLIKGRILSWRSCFHTIVSRHITWDGDVSDMCSDFDITLTCRNVCLSPSPIPNVLNDLIQTCFSSMIPLYPSCRTRQY